MLRGARARQETATRPCERPDFLHERARATCHTRHQNKEAATIGAAPAPPKHGGPLARRRRHIRVDKSAPGDHEGSRQHGATRGWATWHSHTANEPATTPRAASAPPEHGARLEHRCGTQRAKTPSTPDPARWRAQLGVSWAVLVRNAGGYRVVGDRFAVCMGCVVRAVGCLGQRVTWL